MENCIYKDPLEKYTNGINNCNSRMVQKAFSPDIAYNSDYFCWADSFDGLTVNLSVEDEYHLDKSRIDKFFKEDDLTNIPKTMRIQDCYIVTIVLDIKQGYKTDKKIYSAVPIVKLEGVWYIADTQLLDVEF